MPRVCFEGAEASGVCTVSGCRCRSIDGQSTFHADFSAAPTLAPGARADEGIIIAFAAKLMKSIHFLVLASDFTRTGCCGYRTGAFSIPKRPRGSVAVRANVSAESGPFHQQYKHRELSSDGELNFWCWWLRVLRSSPKSISCACVQD